MNINKKLLAISLVAIFSMTILLTSGNDTILFAKNNLKLKDVSKEISAELEIHKDNLQKINKELFNAELDDEKVATVNELIITVDEFNFRNGLSAAAQEHRTDNDIFNKLVEEKIIIAEAYKRGLLPTEEQIIKFIKTEKNNYDSIPEYKEFVDSLINGANISLDDYWDVYERYNAIRIIASKNLFDSLFDIEYENGKLDKNKKGTLEGMEKEKVFSKEMLKDFKKVSKVEIEKVWSNKGLKLNKEIISIK